MYKGKTKANIFFQHHLLVLMPTQEINQHWPAVILTNKVISI